MRQKQSYYKIYATSFTLFLVLMQSLGMAQPVQADDFWSDLWGRIIRRRDQEKPNGSRGIICAVMPQNLNNKRLWHDRPTFVWQGKASLIQVYEKSSKSLVWEQAIKDNRNIITYDGPALLPDIDYTWKAKSGLEETSITFTILDRAASQEIAESLAQLESQMRLKKIPPENQVQQRVDFFLEHELFLDGVQELFSANQPSQPIQDLQQKLIEKSCSAKSAPVIRKVP
jgi:hypothetical protein